ncbi:phosphoribosyl-ATP diphosphatase [Salinisphaera sp.]|uniref:phosphoribosyl-ATP diphosphatase n=1 Tax=Salinisphaera sp. TaxID=1914330 RepID=UPI002D794BAF|nr:phosphoribosyl-ATP diphosphatase [Salinisphaera sp.]HET7314801.1 phosphoribosyl-ATP diphosphatase [Salinisphaera sp.]
MNNDATPATDVFTALDAALAERRTANPTRSYTASLYDGGVAAICDKIDEEAAEVIEAARGDDDSHVVHEVADLWFHCMVLLQSRGLDSSTVKNELARRFGVSGHEEKAARDIQGGDNG